MDNTFSSTKTKQGRPRAVIRLTWDRLGQQPSIDRFSASSEAPIQGLGRRKFSDSLDPSLWCRSPIGALETPCDVTHVPALTNRTSQERQGSSHDVVAHNSIGNSCWSLYRPYWHYTYDPGLRGAALGSYSLERGEITPWFMPPRPRLSMPVKPQGQTHHHRDNHDFMRRSCVVHRATYDRTRRYSIEGQESLLQ
jgi:hypothetical protein